MEDIGSPTQWMKLSQLGQRRVPLTAADSKRTEVSDNLVQPIKILYLNFTKCGVAPLMLASVGFVV